MTSRQQQHKFILKNNVLQSTFRGVDSFQKAERYQFWDRLSHLDTENSNKSNAFIPLPESPILLIDGRTGSPC